MICKFFLKILLGDALKAGRSPGKREAAPSETASFIADVSVNLLLRFFYLSANVIGTE